MITRESLTQLYSPIYDEYMLEEYREDTQVHPQLFKAVMDSTKEYKVSSTGGFGDWVEVGEAESGDYEDQTQGYPKTYTPTKKVKKFQVSFEAVEQDEYAILSKSGSAKSFGKGARYNVEKACANVLNDGFADSGPDGTYFFSNSHPKNREETGTLYDNLLDGALSHDNLEAAELQIADNAYDPAGIPMFNNEDPVLVFSPALRGQVARLLGDRADLKPGTTNNDINRFAGRYRPLEWKMLGAAEGGSDTAWYIIYPEYGYMKIIWNYKPRFTAWIDDEDDVYKFKGAMMFAPGYDNYRAGFASTGA